MLADQNCDPLIHLYLACCYFFLGMYKEADEAAQNGNNIDSIFINLLRSDM